MSSLIKFRLKGEGSNASCRYGNLYQHGNYSVIAQLIPPVANAHHRPSEAIDMEPATYEEYQEALAIYVRQREAEMHNADLAHAIRVDAHRRDARTRTACVACVMVGVIAAAIFILIQQFK